MYRRKKSLREMLRKMERPPKYYLNSSDTCPFRTGAPDPVETILSTLTYFGRK